MFVVQLSANNQTHYIIAQTEKKAKDIVETLKRFVDTITYYQDDNPSVSTSSEWKQKYVNIKNQKQGITGSHNISR